jgi:ATP-dependent Clp protease ATP-binding subunit ClpC
VHDASGLFTGRLIARGSPDRPFVATGESQDSVVEQLRAQIVVAQEDDRDVLEPYLWSETLQTARVKVNVRPQTVVQKRSVIGKQPIPLTLTYAWVALGNDHEARAPAGYRVLLPRFGWSFVLEDLSIAGDVLRQALSAELAGQTARSLFEFREAPRESVIEWRPKLRARQPQSDAYGAEFATLEEVAEDWSALARTGRLGAYYALADANIFETISRAANKPALLLIGPSGVGKTEWVRELARRVARSGDETRLWATSADRIMAGMQYLGLPNDVDRHDQ